jgi:hypothetical protein
LLPVIRASDGTIGPPHGRPTDLLETRSRSLFPDILDPARGLGRGEARGRTRFLDRWSPPREKRGVTDRRARSLPLLLGAGLLAGGACLAAGQLAMGMGHGWDLPRRLGDAGLALDVVAAAGAVEAGPATAVLALPWATLWLSWQIVVIHALSRRR